MTYGTFLAEVDPEIVYLATYIPSDIKINPHLLGILEVGKKYQVTLKEYTTHLGREVFVAVEIHLNPNSSINFVVPKHKVDRYIWPVNSKAAKILYSSKK